MTRKQKKLAINHAINKLVVQEAISYKEAKLMFDETFPKKKRLKWIKRSYRDLK